MYEFEFEIFKYSYNLHLLNGVDWIKLDDTIDPSLVSAGLSYQTPKIPCLTPSRESLVSIVL
jgi:hypothetical protein